MAARLGQVLFSAGCIIALLYVAMGIDTALSLGWQDSIAPFGLAIVSVSMAGALLYALAVK